MALNETPILDVPFAGVGAMQSWGISTAAQVSTTLTVKASTSTTLAVGQTVTISGVAWSTATTTYFITGVITGVSTVTNANDTITLTTASGLGTASFDYASITVGAGSSSVGKITGTLNPYPYGTYKTGDTTPGGFGWSADNHQGSSYISYGCQIAPFTSANGGSNTTGGMLVCDFFLGDLQQLGVGETVTLMSFEKNNGNRIGYVYVDYNRNLCFASDGTGGTAQTNLLTLPNNGWIRLYLASAFSSATGNAQKLALYYQLPGQSSLTQLGTTITETGLGQNAADVIKVGHEWSASYIYFAKFRMARPRLYQIATLADVAVPTGGYQDGCSPLYATSGIAGWVSTASSASASNDGATSTTPITPAEFQTRMQYTGYLPVDPIANSTSGVGTLLSIDTSTKPIAIAGTTLAFETCGMTVQPIAGQQFINITNAKLLASGGFTSDTGTTYKTSDTSSVYEFVWQNNIPLTPLQSQAAVEAMVGSFYSTGSVLYVNPLNGDVPTAATSTYQRSYYINGSLSGIGDPIVSYVADLLVLNGINADGSSLNDISLAKGSYCCQDGTYGIGILSPTTAGPVSAYATKLRTVIENGRFGYILGGHKHTLGQTFAYNNGSLLVQNCDLGLCLPGGSPAVNFSDNVSGRTGPFNATWSQCRCPYPCMTFGQATPVINDDNICWTSHGATSTNFGTITFSAVSTSGSFFDQGAAQTIVFNNGCNTGWISVNSVVMTISDCTVTGVGAAPVQGNNSGGTLTITDSIIIDNGNYNSHGTGTMSGTVVYNGVTFDFSGTIGLGGNYELNAASATGITLRGCVIIGPGGTNPPLNIFKNIPASNCPVVWDDNEYSGIQAGTSIVTSYKGGSTGVTLTAWEALGFDSRSSVQGITAGFTLALSALNSPPYARTASATSKWNRGADGDRYTGVSYSPNGVAQTPIIYAIRNDAGATQYSNGSGGVSPGVLPGVPVNQTGTTSVPSGSTYTVGADIVIQSTVNKTMTLEITAPAGVQVWFQLMAKPVAVGDTPIEVADGSSIDSEGFLAGTNAYPIPGNATNSFSVVVPGPMYAYELAFKTDSGSTQSISWGVTI